MHLPYFPIDALIHSSAFNMNIPHRELATTAAAKLILPRLQRVLADTSATKKQIASDVIPVFGIRRDSQIVRAVTSDRLRRALWSLRNSKLYKTNYQRLSDLARAAKLTEPSFPSDWGRRCLIEKFNLGDVAHPGMGWRYRSYR